MYYDSDYNKRPAQNTLAPIGFELIESEFQTTFNYPVTSYFNQSIPPQQSDIDVNMASIPLRMREAFDGIVKSNRNENFIPTQDFERIKQTYTSRNRFVDTEFRANNDSVFFTRKFSDYLKQSGKIAYRTDQVVWKRAKDLYPNHAHFVVDKQNRFIDLKQINETNYKSFFQTTDLDQGALGNCWFISAATGIIQNYALFKRVVPFDNSFEDLEYNGAFHFKFWIYGTWKDVVIDDFLPIGPDNKLIFSKNRETPFEFWCALFEKAYAKICGSYEALDGGFTTDALIDMSGGIEEVFSLKEIRRSLHSHQQDADKLNANSFWQILLNARNKQSVIGSNIELLDTDQENEVRMHNGLVRGHAYICTKLAELELNRENHRILRVYNPWGNEVEWNGKWSDNSTIWRSVSREIKDKLELKIDKDGEFWMSFEDFVSNFDFCQICNLTPNINSDISHGITSRSLSNIFSMWQCQIFHSQWIYGISSGGRGEPNRDKFWTNPQIAFFINQSDLKDNTCWVIIGLMQKYTRQKRVALQVESAEEYIQFRLFKVRDNDVYFRFLMNGEPIDGSYLERVGSSGAYVNKREVTTRFTLSQGAYIVIPSCYDPDREGEFLVRIFTEMPLNQKECKTLNTSTTTNTARSSSIVNDFKNLSLGASSILNSFVNDFNRQNNHDNKDKKHKRSKHLKPQVTCNQM